MDISPRELRDTDIKERLGGYNRDDVDELLERAATTIEGLSERVRQMSERVAQAENSSTRNRDTEETLQRTLLLAQRTADEAVADAQKRARKTVDDAQNRARTLVSDAESTARRIHEDERRRLEADVRDLASRRDQLKADVDALERFESEYRQRVRDALQAELDSIGREVTTSDLTRPALSQVEVPPPPPERLAPERPAPERPAPERPAPERPAPETAASERPTPEPPRPDPFEGLASMPDDSAEWGGSAAAERAAPAEPAEGGGLSAYVADEPLEAEVLDDDAFFASLREAVRDDETPELVLGDDATSENFFDQDEEDDEGGRRRFRRKR